MRNRFAPTAEEEELEKILKERISFAFLLHLAAEDAFSLTGDFATKDFATKDFGFGEPVNQAAS